MANCIVFILNMLKNSNSNELPIIRISKYNDACVYGVRYLIIGRSLLGYRELISMGFIERSF